MIMTIQLLENLQAEIGSSDRGYSFVVRDLDSNEVIPIMKFFQTLTEAVLYAQTFLGGA